MSNLNKLIDVFSGLDFSSPADRRLQNADIDLALKYKFPDGLKSAAVLLPILDNAGNLELLLTKRSSNLTAHAGEICFPGGGVEVGDNDITMTAIRETKEEVGINQLDIKIIGNLSTVPTFTGYIIHPVIGILLGSPVITIDRTEVESYFTAPLLFFMNQKNKKIGIRKFNNIELPMIEYQYKDNRIWGATAMIISLLCDRLLGGGIR